MLMLENINDLNLYYTITLRRLALKNNITFEQAKFIINIPYNGIMLTSFAKKLGIDNSTYNNALVYLHKVKFYNGTMITEDDILDINDLDSFFGR